MNKLGLDCYYLPLNYHLPFKDLIKLGDFKLINECCLCNNIARQFVSDKDAILRRIVKPFVQKNLAEGSKSVLIVLDLILQQKKSLKQLWKYILNFLDFKIKNEILFWSPFFDFYYLFFGTLQRTVYFLKYVRKAKNFFESSFDKYYFSVSYCKNYAKMNRLEHYMHEKVFRNIQITLNSNISYL